MRRPISHDQHFPERFTSDFEFAFRAGLEFR